MLTPAEENWEYSYNVIGEQRLWLVEPTLDGLDLEQWYKQGVRLILDAGCGDGKNLAYLAQKGFFVAGLDVSVSALQNCQIYLNRRQLAQQVILFAPTGIESNHLRR